MDEIDRFDVTILRRGTVNSVSLLFCFYSFIFISALVNTIEQIKTFTDISFLFLNILMRNIIYKKHYIITNEDDTMIPEERSSYTLTEEEVIIFATAKFKPFHS